MQSIHKDHFLHEPGLASCNSDSVLERSKFCIFSLILHHAFSNIFLPHQRAALYPATAFTFCISTSFQSTIPNQYIRVGKYHDIFENIEKIKFFKYFYTYRAFAHTWFWLCLLLCCYCHCYGVNSWTTIL